MTAPSVGSQIAARFVASDDVATREQLCAAIDAALSVQANAALIDAARDFEWFGRIEIQPGQRGLAQAHDKMRTALESQPAAIAGDSVQALIGTWDARAKSEHEKSQDKTWAEWLRDRHHGASGAFSTCKLELEAALSSAPAAPASVAGDAVAKLPAKWREAAESIHRGALEAREADGSGALQSALGTAALHRRVCADDLEAALAQDRAAQGAPAAPSAARDLTGPNVGGATEAGAIVQDGGEG